jgi:hypothetical protein
MMVEVMQRFPHWRFQLQTNGTLLDDLPEWVLARLSNVLVSIDGGEAITDGYRGRGIYRQVLKNLRQVRASHRRQRHRARHLGQPGHHLRGTRRTGRRWLALRLPVLAVRGRRACMAATRWKSARRCWCS